MFPFIPLGHYFLSSLSLHCFYPSPSISFHVLDIFPLLSRLIHYLSPFPLISLFLFALYEDFISVSISLYLYRPLHGCRHNQCERGGDDASCPLANRSDAYTDMMSQYRHRRSFPLLHFTPQSRHLLCQIRHQYTLTLETGSRHRTRRRTRERVSEVRLML